MAKPALGRGLGALLSAKPASSPAPAAPVASAPAPKRPEPTPAAAEVVRRVTLDKVVPCPLQPRKDFQPDALRELADSIQAQGIVQPLIVRERSGRLELIAGERRWRAAKLLELKEVPVIVREADDRSVLELALIENLQRENLNPIEEALGYSQLLEQFQLTQEEIASKVGKSRAAVANALRLLRLPEHVQAHVREGKLSTGHAKAILGLPDADFQSRAAEKILKGGLNVRQTESLVAELQQTKPAKPNANGIPAPAPDPHVASLEDRIRQRMGTKVHLKYASGRGSIDIAFFSDAELERILAILGVQEG